MGKEMAHLKIEPTRAEATPKEWLRIGRDIGTLVNTWSHRDDLVAYVGPGAGGSAPACYNPTLAEVEVNVDVAFGFGIVPEAIGDITTRKAQYEFPKAIGAVQHEAFHARFSQWSMPTAHAELANDEYKALILLEESRIEYHGLQSMPSSRSFLRACALEIVIGDIKEGALDNSATIQLTNLVGLVHARIDAGILDTSEVYEITKMIEDNLGIEVVSKLRAIACEAQLHDKHRDATELYPLAKEWAKIVRELAKERGDEEKPEGGCKFPISAEMLEEILDALEEGAGAVEVNNFEELADQEQGEDWKEQVKGKANEAKEQQENKDVAKEVFSKSSGAGARGTKSRLIEQRNPTSDETIASVKIGKLLEKAKYRERDEKVISSELPPGRLRTRAIVQQKALRARGIYVKAEPFRKTVRKHTDDPTLNVGIMVDISGSMGSAMKPMATTAWVMANAVKRIQGRCAMVYFGNDVFPTLKVGQKLPQVSVYSAEDGTEKFEKGFKALDGALNLLHGRGAKLLVIVSDGQYTPNETEKAKEIVRRCEQAGVAILWLPFDAGRTAQEIGGTYAEIVTGISEPALASEIIGKAGAKVLTKIGRRQMA